jgi:hypothetical protein
LADGVDAAVLGRCTRVPEVESIDQVGGIVDEFAYWRRGVQW